MGKLGILSWANGLSSRGVEKGFGGRGSWREPGSPGEEENPQQGRQGRLWKIAAAPERELAWPEGKHTLRALILYKS